MEKWMRLSAVLAVLVAGACFAPAAEEEKEAGDTTVKQAELPQKVADTVKEFGKGGYFVKAVKADEDGVAVYEVTVSSGGKDVEVQTTLDGDLNMREEKIEAGDLPKAVVDRLMKEHPGAKIEAAEKTIRTMYELQIVDKKGKKAEALVTPGGQMMQEPEELDKPGKGEKEENEGNEANEKEDHSNSKKDKKEKSEEKDKD